ncbi:helix-turn-helix domain-containing protein [Saccharopolyspora shandongensis]|uniref:helix-turn-helix domain-containing protein n=1 Tax=Saccharopolyspora shandongensis TaxID=418495 RepID=UPI0033EE11AA
MAKSSLPTVRKRRLAATLRSLREQAGVTPEQVMQEMDWSRSKVSKVETANIGVSVSDVRVLCDLYRAEPEVAEWLTQTARDARRRGWWDAYDEAMPTSFADYVELESEATHAHYFEIDLIPGLLQTEDYALALMETTAPQEDEQNIQARTELRMRRQERLHAGDLSLWAIIDESALLRGTGTQATRRAQLRHLLDAMDMPNIVLQILPLRAGAHAASGSPFGQLHFPEPIPSVVFVDNVAGSLYIEEPDEVARFSTAFDHLRATALDARESRKLLNAALRAVDSVR